MKRVTILFLFVVFTLLLTLSVFALTREERAWKEDILILLKVVKTVGDYKDLVELIEVAPSLKEDLEIRKAFITFAPKGMSPPSWAREERVEKVKAKRVAKVEEIKEPEEKREIEIPKKIPVEVKEEARPLTKEEKKEVRKHYLIGKRYYNAQEDRKAIEEFKKALALNPTHKKAIRYLSESHYHLGRKYYRDEDYQKAKHEFENALDRNPEHKKAKEYFTESQARIEERAEEARRIALEVAEQEKVRKEPLKIESLEKVEVMTEGPPEKIAIAEEALAKEEIEVKVEKELGIIPTPLPKGAKVIHSTDVVSGVKAEMVEGKMRVTITLSGERKYTVSERGRPPAIVIDIPHTINAVFPGRVMVNQGGVRTVEVIQHRAVPFDGTRVIIRLSRFKEYEVKSKENEIHVEFEE
ncbi:Cell division coordinator CpoB [subsurface metagenome]